MSTNRESKGNLSNKNYKMYWMNTKKPKWTELTVMSKPKFSTIGMTFDKSVKVRSGGKYHRDHREAQGKHRAILSI